MTGLEAIKEIKDIGIRAAGYEVKLTDFSEVDEMLDTIEYELKKYKKLKDIEEKLGINLITLFKGLKDGIYGKVGNKIEHILAPHFSFHLKKICIYKIKDYGKTWALTSEELQ